jgi:hypothetical protein
MSRKFIFGGSFSGVAPLLLDLYPATAAYSVRKLRNAYSGACMRVRRSSDNTEQDIFFSGNDLDTAALLSFVGAGNGFITTWYDQSGSGFNLTQTSAGSQPRIVNAGVVELENGIPALNWYGTTQFLTGGNILSIGLGNNMAGFVVARNTVTTNRAHLISKSVAAGMPNRWTLITGGSAGTTALIGTGFGDFTAQSNIAHANQSLFNFQFLRNTSVSAHVNNNQVALTSLIGETGTSDYRFLVGATNNSTNNGEIAYHRGTFQEVIIYQQPTTPTLSDVNTLINNHYAIY